MKKFLGLALLLSSLSSFAATVKVTSFNYVPTSGSIRVPMAELCGLVEGASSSPSFVQVLVDPRSSNPGSYNTFAGANGKFCIAVVTFRGTAEVSLMGENTVVNALIK